MYGMASGKPYMLAHLSHQIGLYTSTTLQGVLFEESVIDVFATERRNKAQLSDSATVLAVGQALTATSTYVTAAKDSPSITPVQSMFCAVSLIYTDMFGSFAVTMNIRLVMKLIVSAEHILMVNFGVTNDEWSFRISYVVCDCGNFSSIVFILCVQN